MTNRWTRKPEALAQTHFVCRGSRMRGKHGSNICIVTVKWRSTVSLWYVDYGRQPEKSGRQQVRADPVQAYQHSAEGNPSWNSSDGDHSVIISNDCNGSWFC